MRSRLSSLDSFFLYHERKEWPLHIGMVSIFDGEIGIEEVVRSIGSRIDYVPRYRQRLAGDALNLAHPRWETDPGFDLRNHIREERLEGGGSDEELSGLASRLMGERLDRTRPLWDLRVVQGLEGGRTAYISRVHHCMVDGVSGVDLMKIMFDLTPAPGSEPVPEVRGDAAGEGTDAADSGRRLFDAVMGGMEEVLERVVDVQKSLLTLTRSLLDDGARESLLAMGAKIPELLLPVSPLPFNGPLSGERRFIWLRLGLAEARAIREVLGGSVNDVILAVLGRAISRYAARHGESLGGRRVRVMVPVNVRREDRRGRLGNAISLLPVEVPLDIDDPTELFRQISRQTLILKSGQMAEAVNLLLSAFGTVPAPLQSTLGALLNLPVAPFNLIATNVPGPQIPLYSIGRRLVATYPCVPIAYDIGFGVAIMSYDQGLFLGLTADSRRMSDVEWMRDLIDESFEELRMAAGGEQQSGQSISDARRSAGVAGG